MRKAGLSELSSTNMLIILLVIGLVFLCQAISQQAEKVAALISKAVSTAPQDTTIELMPNRTNGTGTRSRMHTMIDSIIANVAVWVLVSLILIAPIQTEQVSRSLKEAWNMSRAAEALRRAEALGYVDELARSEGDGAAAERALAKITSLIPPGCSYALSWNTEDGKAIKALRSGDLKEYGHVTIIISAATHTTYLTLQVAEG